MKTLPETITVNGKTIKYDVDAFVAQYELRKTLPSPKIVCTETGTLITAFGPNLHGKVAKYGGIRNLLTQFVCQKAKKAAIPTAEVPDEIIVAVGVGDEIHTSAKKIAEILEQVA